MKKIITLTAVAIFTFLTSCQKSEDLPEAKQEIQQEALSSEIETDDKVISGPAIVLMGSGVWKFSNPLRINGEVYTHVNCYDNWSYNCVYFTPNSGRSKQGRFSPAIPNRLHFYYTNKVIRSYWVSVIWSKSNELKGWGRSTLLRKL